MKLTAVVLFAALASAWLAPAGFAQQAGSAQDAPEIDLGLGQNPAPPAPVAVEPPTPAVQPQPEPPAAAPVPAQPDQQSIQLQPSPPEAAPESGAPASAPEMGGTPNVIQRDKGVASEGADAKWRLPLLPATNNIPQVVRVGESYSEPGVLRLTGELVSSTLRVITPTTVPSPKEIVLTLQTSVNVLNDSATMLVQVNDAAPVELPLTPRLSFTEMVVPTDALVPGENRVTLTLRQPHRIFCGPDATFAVFTEIDLKRSGIDVAAAAVGANAEGFMLAVSSVLGSGRDLRLIAPENADPRVVRHVADQMAAGLGYATNIEVGSPYDLVERRHAVVAVIPGNVTQASFRRGRDGAVVLQVEYAPDEFPDLTEIVAQFPKVAVQASPMLALGREVPLSELGMVDTTGNTNYFLYERDFTLPTTWLLLADQKAELTLHYGFAAGLPQGSILLVKVNETTVQMLPLDREEGGKLMPLLTIPFNANLLHAGHNAVSFEMIVPGLPADEVCVPRRSAMLALKADSTLHVPPSPAMMIPGLNIQLLGLKGTSIVAPENANDKKMLDQAALRLAASYGTAVRGSDNVRVSVLGLNDLSMLPLGNLDVTVRNLQSALFPTAPAPAAVAVASAAQPVSEGAGNDVTAPAEPLLTDDPLLTPDALEARADAPGVFDRFGDWVGLQFSSQGVVARKVSGFIERGYTGSSQTFGNWLEGQTGQALLVRPDRDVRGDLYLLLGRGAEPAEIGRQLASLRDSGLGRGEAALLQEDGTWQIWSPVRLPLLIDDLRWDNLLVVIGNYASWSPLLFSLSLMILALISAIPALLYVLLSRRRGDE